MSRLLKAVDKFCRDMNMCLAIDKMVLLTAGSNDTTWKLDDDGPDLEASLIAKYRVSQKTWEFSDEFDIVFVMN